MENSDFDADKAKKSLNCTPKIHQFANEIRTKSPYNKSILHRWGMLFCVIEKLFEITISIVQPEESLLTDWMNGEITTAFWASERHYRGF